MHSNVITLILLFTINTSLSKTDTVRTDSSFYYMIDDCLADRVFQKLKELVKLAANICFWMNWSCLCFSSQGFWYFAEKKAKFLGIFRGKFEEKSADFAGFSRGKKSKFAKKNRPISQDFRGRKIKIRRKIGRFYGNLAADFTGNFGGKLRQETINKKQPILLDFFWQISLKSMNFVLIWPALCNVF